MHSPAPAASSGPHTTLNNDPALRFLRRIRVQESRLAELGSPNRYVIFRQLIIALK